MAVKSKTAPKAINYRLAPVDYLRGQIISMRYCITGRSVSCKCLAEYVFRPSDTILPPVTASMNMAISLELQTRVTPKRIRRV